MAGAGRNDRLLRGVFSKDLERRHPMRTRQPDSKERIEVLLEEERHHLRGRRGNRRRHPPNLLRSPRRNLMNRTLEVVQIPVSDVDRAESFYANLQQISARD
jgi:hypothetical protein